VVRRNIQHYVEKKPGGEWCAGNRNLEIEGGYEEHTALCREEARRGMVCGKQEPGDRRWLGGTYSIM
jgi:hypothetical protein